MGKRKLEQTEGDQEQERENTEAPSNQPPQDSDTSSDNSSEQELSSEDLVDSSSDSEDGSSSGPDVSDEEKVEDSDDPDKFDKIDVNFEFFDPKESDFHGLKALLHSYLDGQQYDSSQLIDAIIQQVRGIQNLSNCA